MKDSIDDMFNIDPGSIPKDSEWVKELLESAEEWSANSELRELTAQESLVLYYMFFDLDNQ